MQNYSFHRPRHWDLTDGLQTMCLAVPDLARKDITIAISRRLTDGTWGKPVPVD